MRHPIDALLDAAVQKRIAVATTAAMAKALAEGERVSIIQEDIALWLYPDGRTEPMTPKTEEHGNGD